MVLIQILCAHHFVNQNKMRPSSRLNAEQAPLQVKSKHSHRRGSGRAGQDSRLQDSISYFKEASHDESLPLRRRHVPLPLPPSSCTVQSYQTTQTSNHLMGASQSGLHSSTSSLAQSVRHPPKRANESKSVLKRASLSKHAQAAASHGSQSRLSHKQSSHSLAKENTQSTANCAKVGHSSHRFVASENLPAGPSSHHLKSSLPKAQSGKRLKQLQAKKEKSAHEKKLHTLQLQFMHDTLSKLQVEKMNRAEAINRAILRKSSNQSQINFGGRASVDLSSTAKCNTSSRKVQASDLRRSRNASLQESLLSKSSRRSRSARSALSRSRNESAESRGAILYGGPKNHSRVKPRLCEIAKFQDSVINQSESLLGRSQAHHNESSERATSSRGAQKNIRASSRSSSLGHIKRNTKKKSTAKLRKTQQSAKASILRTKNVRELEENMTRRQMKLEQMERDFLQRQINSTPVLHMNEISQISPNVSAPSQFYILSAEQQQQLAASSGFLPQTNESQFVPPDMFSNPKKSTESDQSDCEEEGQTTDVGDRETLEDQSYSEPEVLTVEQQQFMRVRNEIPRYPMQSNQHTFARSEALSISEDTAQSQEATQEMSHQVVHAPLQVAQLTSATDEKVPAPQKSSASQHVLSQVTIPQIGSIQHIGCFDLQSQSVQEPEHTRQTLLQRFPSSKSGLSTEGVPVLPSLKHSSANRDERRAEVETPKETTQLTTKGFGQDSSEQASSAAKHDQNKIVAFFEQEYRGAQKELLDTKGALYEQKFKTDVLKKKLAESEQLVEQLKAQVLKLGDENKELKGICEMQAQQHQPVHGPLQHPHPLPQTARPAPPQQLSYRSSSMCNKDVTTQRSISCLQSERAGGRENHEAVQPLPLEATREFNRIRDENQKLVAQNELLLSKLDGLQGSQKSQEVLIQFLQGTQNSILQKMQHQLIKSQFTSNLAETAQLATSFLTSGEKGQRKQEPIPKTAYVSGTSQAPSSLDLNQFIALRKEDISGTIEDYFKRTNEAAGLTSEKKQPEEAAADRGESSEQVSGLQPRDEANAPLQIQQQRDCYFGQGLILPHNDQGLTSVINEAGPGQEAESVVRDRHDYQSVAESHASHLQNDSSLLNDYDSKTFSEHHRQQALQKRLKGISPVTNVRRTETRRSLSYQKSSKQSQSHSQNQSQHQGPQSSNKGGGPATNDVSIVSLSQVNSNSKYLVPKQMRQLLCKPSSEDGEVEDYLQTGAFEKRSNEMRLFSLDGTAQQDIQNMIDLSHSQAGPDSKQLSPVKDFLEPEGEAHDYQSSQLLNQVQNLSLVHHQPGQQDVCSPEILNQVRHNIVFSNNAKTRGEEEESQLSSPEMNCTQTDSRATNTNNASMKTREQHEIKEIIATTKQFTCGTNPDQSPPDFANEYASNMPRSVPSLSLRDQAFARHDRFHQAGQPPVKSPSFNQVPTLPTLSKQTSPKATCTYASLPEGNASQEVYSKTQNSMQMCAAGSARPLSTCKVSSDMMITQKEASDERSVTTVSASFLHNIKRSNLPMHRKNNPSMTSNDTVPADFFLHRENTHGSSCNLSALQCPLGGPSGTLSHMPTEQCMPQLTSSFQNQLPIGAHGSNVPPLATNASVQHATYSPFRTHQPGQLQPGGRDSAQHASSGRRPHRFSQSRSTSPTPSSAQQDYYSSSAAHAQARDLASSSERIQNRTKKMKEEIHDIDRDIAMLHNVISR